MSKKMRDVTITTRSLSRRMPVIVFRTNIFTSAQSVHMGVIMTVFAIMMLMLTTPAQQRHIMTMVSVL